MRVGFNRVDFTVANSIVASGIVDGGFQSFPLTQGDVITLRRNGPKPFSDNPWVVLTLSELKLYEAANLL